MPYKPKKPCKHPGCAGLIDSKSMYCGNHKPLHPESVRSASKRGYGSKWQRVRKEYLKHHPLCVECMRHGKYTEATVVDHVTPHRGDIHLMWSESNFQALCKRCHDSKTGKHDSRPTYKYK